MTDKTLESHRNATKLYTNCLKRLFDNAVDLKLTTARELNENISSVLYEVDDLTDIVKPEGNGAPYGWPYSQSLQAHLFDYLIATMEVCPLDTRAELSGPPENWNNENHIKQLQKKKKDLLPSDLIHHNVYISD